MELIFKHSLKQTVVYGKAIDDDAKRRNTMKNYIIHPIYKIMDISSFIRQIEWRSMLEWLDPKEGKRILDVACGGGALSLKIAEKGCEVHGIDLSEDVIERHPLCLVSLTAENISEVEE